MSDKRGNSMNTHEQKYKDAFRMLAKYIVMTRRAAECDVYDNAEGDNFSYWHGKRAMALDIENAADRIITECGLDNEIWGLRADMDGMDVLEVVSPRKGE